MAFDRLRAVWRAFMAPSDPSTWANPPSRDLLDPIQVNPWPGSQDARSSELGEREYRAKMMGFADVDHMRTTQDGWRKDFSEGASQTWRAPRELSPELVCDLKAAAHAVAPLSEPTGPAKLPWPERAAYRCGTCGSEDLTKYARCEHPGCPDGRDR